VFDSLKIKDHDIKKEELFIISNNDVDEEIHKKIAKD
jgi:hypothetical protein